MADWPERAVWVGERGSVKMEKDLLDDDGVRKDYENARAKGFASWLGQFGGSCRMGGLPLNERRRCFARFKDVDERSQGKMYF